MPNQHRTSACGNIRLTLCTAEQAMQERIDDAKPGHFIDVCGSEESAEKIQLPIIMAFCDSINTECESHPDATIFVCPESKTSTALANACLLFGAYRILCQDVGMDQLVVEMKEALDEIEADHRHTRIQQQPSTRHKIIMDSWVALHQARALNWLGARPSEVSEPLLDVEMATHYARPINGNIHILIPGKLILFPTPHQLPAGHDWADDSDGARNFSAGFLAELLEDLGVAAVACLGRVHDADAAAFRGCALDVHELGLDPRRPALLPAMDRLLAVSRAAPGAVALCGGGGGAAGEDVVETMAAAWLMRECGFGEGAAGAWLRMVRPRACLT